MGIPRNKPIPSRVTAITIHRIISCLRTFWFYCAMGTDYSKVQTMNEIVYDHHYDRPRGNTVERMMCQFRTQFGLKPTAPVRPTQQALTDGGKARPPREPQPARANRPVDHRAMYNRMIRHHPACNQVKALLNMEGCLRQGSRAESRAQLSCPLRGTV